MSNPPSPVSPLDEHELLAAEYALGVLEGADRARVESMAKSSPAFAARIAAWEARLSPLADEIAPEAAPNLLPDIEARLFGTSRRRFALPDGWLFGLVGTGVMAALSVVVVGLLLQYGGMGPAPAPIQSATLQAAGNDYGFSAQIEGGQLVLTQIKGAGPATGRSFELWLIDGDKPPVSLGLVDHGLTVPAPTAAAGYVLAITDEPFGGGPGGIPTGQIIAAGSFTEL